MFDLPLSSVNDPPPPGQPTATNWCPISAAFSRCGTLWRIAPRQTLWSHKQTGGCPVLTCRWLGRGFLILLLFLPLILFRSCHPGAPRRTPTPFQFRAPHQGHFSPADGVPSLGLERPHAELRRAIRFTKKRGGFSPPRSPYCSYKLAYSAASAAACGLATATVSVASPTLKRAKRRTEMFSPSLPITVAISCVMVTDCSLMKGCSSRQTSS